MVLHSFRSNLSFHIIYVMVTGGVLTTDAKEYKRNLKRTLFLDRDVHHLYRGKAFEGRKILGQIRNSVIT